MVDALGEIEAALERLAAVDPNQLDDQHLADETIRLLQLTSRLTAITAQRAAAADSRQLHRAELFRAASTWLAQHAHTSKRAARSVLRLGRFCRDLDQIGAAWRTGQIDTEHVRTMHGVHNARTDPAMRDQQKTLIDTATTIARFPAFENAIQYWTHLADPDGREPDTDQQLARNQFTLGPASDGMVLGSFQLDPISGAIVQTTIRNIYDQLFNSEWADTRTRLGRDPSLAELPRTHPQRMAAALVDMATRARTAPPGGRTPAPLFTVLVGEDTFRRTCELSNQQVLTAGALVPYITHADIERVVFDTPARVIEVGTRTRFFRGALRRAIEVRDRHCQGPGCDEPPERCDIDHTIPHAAHGPTTQDNGRLYCPWHNHNRPHAGPPHPSHNTNPPVEED